MRRRRLPGGSAWPAWAIGWLPLLRPHRRDLGDVGVGSCPQKCLNHAISLGCRSRGQMRVSVRCQEHVRRSWSWSYCKFSWPARGRTEWTLEPGAPDECFSYQSPIPRCASSGVGHPQGHPTL